MLVNLFLETKEVHRRVREEYKTQFAISRNVHGEEDYNEIPQPLASAFKVVVTDFLSNKMLEIKQAIKDGLKEAVLLTENEENEQHP